jgi:hypothetical protein
MAKLITISEAAAVLNRSHSAISRALREGRLHYADPSRRLLAREGIEARFARSTRPRIDRPVPKPREAVEAPSGGIEAWDQVAELCNAQLDPTAWEAPPWSALRWQVLATLMADAGVWISSEAAEA